MFFPIYWDKDTETVSFSPGDGLIKILPMKSQTEEGRWRIGIETARQRASHLFARYMPTKHQWSVFEKDYLDNRSFVKPTTLMLDKCVNTERGTEQAREIFEGKLPFDYPKPVGFIELVISLITAKNPIILDSFSGSGTTAHAVLNLNKQDGGNRRFILVELGDYADTVTAERVRRVVKGYGEGSKAVEGTGGSFSFYELGDPLFVDGNLNPVVPVERVREYVWFTETQTPYELSPLDGYPYFLGVHNDTSYVFIFEPDRATVLDRLALSQIPGECGAGSYVIYADTCVLSDDELRALNITFKKIPRDITRL